MQKTIISDTSCLILLNHIGELELLRTLFKEVYITSVIAEEYETSLPEWIKIKDPQDKNYYSLLRSFIDKGEASGIALAVEHTDCLIIIDDLKARKLAGQLNIKFTGTLGVLVEAKKSGLLNSIKPILKKIKETDFRLTTELERKILEISGELQ